MIDLKNVCIVGYGAVGAVHASSLMNIDEANLYAVCDIDEKRIALCKEKYDVVAYTDYSEMLEDENIDSVHICTPHYLHYEMVKLAHQKGKRVLCEKPVAITDGDFESLKNLPGVDKVALVFQNRLNNCVIRMKELLSSGDLGEIKGIRGLVTWYRSKEYYTNSLWRGKWSTEGGGVLINQTVHTLDLMGYLAGGFKSLKARMTNFSLSDVIEVEDTFVASLRMNNDAKAVFFATNSYSSNSSPDIEIVCENGKLHYTDGMLLVNGEIICKDSLVTGEKAYWGKGHEKLFYNLYALDEYFTVFDSENTMKTVYAMYESAKNEGKEIII